jgi:hypothetical protein
MTGVVPACEDCGQVGHRECKSGDGLFAARIPRRRIAEAPANPTRQASLEPAGKCEAHVPGGPEVRGWNYCGKPLPCERHPPQAAPVPNPSEPARKFAEHLPTVRTAAPVEELLGDILALCTREVTRLKGSGALGAREFQSLESIAKTVKLTHELERQVRRELEEEFGKEGEDRLRERAEELRRKLGDGHA